METSTDRIERKILIRGTPCPRSGAALSNAAEFGSGLVLISQAKTLSAQTGCRGRLPIPVMEHLTMEVQIERYCAGAIVILALAPSGHRSAVDFSQEPTDQLVVFELQESRAGFMLSVGRNSGLDKIPWRRATVIRLNSSGWSSRWRILKSMSPRRRSASKSRPLQIHAPLFAALGDEMRLRLIAALCVGGAMSITQLTSGMDISRQASPSTWGAGAAGWFETSRSDASDCGNSSRRNWMRRAGHWN